MQRDNWRIVIALIGGLIATDFSADLAKQIALPAVLEGVPYLRSAMSYVIDIVVMVALLRLVGGIDLSRQWETIGLGKAWRPSALMGACLFAPLLIAGALFGSLAPDESFASLAFLGVVAPLAEEVTYRGLGTGILIALVGWRFWPAALLPAAVFGLLHAGQGEGLTEIATVVAITGVGGLFFSWLYVRFGRNLWPPVVMHVGMNGLWNLFDLGDNAIGGWLGNALRAASVLGAIGFALWGQDWLDRTTGSKRSA